MLMELVMGRDVSEPESMLFLQAMQQAEFQKSVHVLFQGNCFVILGTSPEIISMLGCLSHLATCPQPARVLKTQDEMLQKCLLEM